MNLSSKELFINMKERDIPVWNPIYPFDEQDDDVKQFWMNEAMKLMNGVTINGVFIHPWLYWHINFWKMMIDVDPEVALKTGVQRVPGQSELRDNEWLFAEFLKQAEEENKGIFMFGCRRFGKALLDSEILYLEDREKPIGDILVGDMIYDDEGKLTRVEGVFPQGKVMTYRVVFEDGRSIVCSGDHLWKVFYHGEWHIRSLKAIFSMNVGDVYIPLTKAVDYPQMKLPIPPDVYGSIMVNYIMGYPVDVPFSPEYARRYLRSSIAQKKRFVESFLKGYATVFSSEEKIPCSPDADRKIVNFILRMFWSYGWYAGLDDGKLFVSGLRSMLKMESVTVYGKQNATCIKVDNRTKMFLTTNYVATHNTAIMSSLLARNATMTYNLSHNVIGASKEDLSQMTEYLEFGLDNLPPFLKINRTGTDWTKEVILGNSTVRNERDVHARIRIINLDSGKSSSLLKPAGGTPYTTIYDEVGKFPVLGPYMAGLPSHMMHGRMRGLILLAGTGGQVEKSQDAQKIMNNPEDYKLIVMNYDLLNRHTLHPTWRISSSGCFVPAQMSHAFTKHETTLDKYLNISDAKDLHKIKIQVSDFDENTKKIKDTRVELAKKDRSLLVQERMAYPLTIDDCFLNANINRFPVEDALLHKSRLLEQGRPGKLVDIYQIEGMRMGWHFSEKQLASYPFQGGNIDSPIVIYEDPPEEGGNFEYIYASGQDPYKSEKADTDSLGAFYVFKRLVGINDPYANRIVASYVSRPGVSDDFCRNCEILQEAYGARCLMENADRMYEIYLKRKNKDIILLEDGEQLVRKVLNPRAKQNNKFGLPPTRQNQNMIINAVLQYCWEDVIVGYDEEGNEITQKGIYRIDDIELLDEIVAFGPGVNTDRIIAFGHALVLAKYYDDLGFMPKSPTERQNEEKVKRRKIWQVKGFSVAKRNPYAGLRFRKNW